MVRLLLSITQALAVGAFLIAGVLSFILQDKVSGSINLSLFFTNFFVFYGSQIFK